jgi:hypothetical protein
MSQLGQSLPGRASSKSGHVRYNEAEKNSLCAPVPSPYLDIDWLRVRAVSVKNRAAWSQHPGIEQWLAQSRLDSFFASVRRVQPTDSDRLAVLQRYRGAAMPAIAKLPQLLASVA